MFTVICEGPEFGSRKLVSQGVSFGFLNSPIIFNVTTPEIEVPLRVNFYLRKVGERESGTIVVGNIKNNTVDVEFYTDIENGRSGLSTPIGIVALGESELVLSFHLQLSSKAPDYLIYYSFYESPLNNEVKE